MKVGFQTFRPVYFALVAASALSLNGCFRASSPLIIQDRLETVTAPAMKIETGKASFYADELAGKRTASGEPYQPTKLTAAHRTLPFGTIVEVRNLSNGRTVSVRINDRGPFVNGRVIDLSRGAAQALNFEARGVCEAELRYTPVS